MTAIGLIGCGRWGRNILRDLLSLNCIVHVVDPDPDARERALATGAASAVASFGEMKADVAGFVVASETKNHHACILQCLETGRAVFTEKPLCPDVAEAEDLARRGAGRVFVMDKWRYHPGIERLGQIQRDGELGKPLLLSTRRLQWGMPHDDVDTAWILAPHELTIALEIMGEIPPLDHVSGVVESGRVLEASASLSGMARINIAVSSLSPDYDRCVRLVCEGGTAWLDDPGDAFITIVRRPGDGTRERLSIPVDMPLLRELSTFVAFLGGGPPPRSSVEEGLTVVRRITEIRAALGGQS